MNSAIAVDCVPADIALISQEEVDSFQENHGPGCDTITGALMLMNGEFQSLAGLSGIKRVEGHLSIIANFSLASLDGLEQLNFVGGDLELRKNSILSSLNGLKGLQFIGGEFIIEQNDSLQGISPLGKLAKVGGLRVWNSEALKNVDGLSGLQVVEGDVSIRWNGLLSDLKGLRGLSIVAGDFELHDLPTLTQIAELSWLNHIGGDLGIVDLPLLLNLDGFRTLKTVGGAVGLGQNDSLTNLNGLSALTRVGSGISLSSNDNLVNVNGLAGITGDLNGYLSVSYNRILDDLDGLSGITRIFGDLLITANENLSSLRAFSNLNHVGGALRVQGNNLLPSLTGLSGLRYVVEEIRVADNPLLTNLDALSGITHVVDSLSIERNDSLEDIDGLARISQVGFVLSVNDNPQLKNLDGLIGLNHVQRGVSITNNPKLTTCAGLIPLLDDLDDGPPGPGPQFSGVPDVGSSLTLEDNSEACNSVDRILADEAVTTFEIARMFSDENPAYVSVWLDCDAPNSLLKLIRNPAKYYETAAFEVRRFTPALQPRCNVRVLPDPELDGYAQDASDCQELPLVDGSSLHCEIRYQQLPVNVTVEKSFTDGFSGNVEVTLDCPTANVQTVDGTASRLDAAEFVVSDMPWHGTTCTASEGELEGYVQQATSCSELLVEPGHQPSCGFVNAPRPPDPESLSFAMTGSWYDSASSGEGFMVHAVDADTAVAYFYGYDDEGGRLWLIATSDGPIAWGESIEFEAYVVSGGGFEEFDREQVVEAPWGTLTLTFEDCFSGNAVLAGLHGEKSLNLVRLGDVAGSPCSPTGQFEDTDAVTGSWYDPRTSGQGFAIHKVSGQRGVVYFYGFDKSGANLWLIGTWEDGLDFGAGFDVTLLQITGGTYGEVNPEVISEELWGDVSLRFEDCRSGTATLHGNDGIQVLDLKLLAGSMGLACDQK